MRLHARFALTHAEALRGNRAFKRTSYVLSVLAGLMLLVGGLVGAILSPSQRVMSLFLAFDGLLLACLPELALRWALIRRGPSPQAPVEVAFHEEGLLYRAGGAEGEVPWEAFSDIHRRSGFWLFRLTSHRAVLVPERALSASDSQILEAFLRARRARQA